MILSRSLGVVASSRAPAASGGAAAVAFLQGAQNTASAAEYTFASQSLGDADAGRHIIVVGHARAVGATALAVSGVTVGGVTASLAVERAHLVTNGVHSFIAIAAVPSGTSGNVVVTYSRAVARAGIYLYRTTGLTGTTATDTDSVASSVPAAHTVNIDVSAGGVAVGGASRNDTGTCTWTGLTENYDTALGASGVTGAAAAFASAQSPLAVTANWAGGGFGEGASVYASFR